MTKLTRYIICMSVAMMFSAAFAGQVTGDDSAEINSLLNDMSPEQLEALVQAAAENSLRVERQAVLAEISQNILYDETDIEKASAKLKPNDKLSQADNIASICEAFAIVDGRFAGAYSLYKDGKFVEAAEKLKAMINPEDATYLSAVMHYVRADSLARAEKYMDAAEAFSDILVNMPERLSFAAGSARRAAEAYEKAGRNYYAMQMYTYCLANYSLTLTRPELDAMFAKVKQYREIYANPMMTVVGMMDEVESRLAEKDLGQKVQEDQQQIVALLEDMIKTAEESQRRKDNQQQNQQGRQSRQDSQQQGDKKPGSKESQGQQLSNTQNPSSPASESVLVPGPVSRPNKLATKHQAKGTGRWADMPPRQREKLQSIMRQRLAERRARLVRDYHKKLAESE